MRYRTRCSRASRQLRQWDCSPLDLRPSPRATLSSTTIGRNCGEREEWLVKRCIGVGGQWIRQKSSTSSGGSVVLSEKPPGPTLPVRTDCRLCNCTRCTSRAATGRNPWTTVARTDPSPRISWWGLPNIVCGHRRAGRNCDGRRKRCTAATTTTTRVGPRAPFGIDHGRVFVVADVRFICKQLSQLSAWTNQCDDDLFCFCTE